MTRPTALHSEPPPFNPPLAAVDLPRTVTLHTGDLEVRVTNSDLPLDALTGFATRNNPKRGFLFVSKVLGKHLPVRPSAMLESYRTLARKMSAPYLDALPQPLLSIGMAETATALGQGVFDAYTELCGCAGLHINTTRYNLAGPCHTFSEDHSHATAHYLHIPQETLPHRTFSTARTLILVDDEISTGNTLADLVKVLSTHNPYIERIVIVALLNWLSPARQAELAKEFPCRVDFVSLLEGEFTFAPNPDYAFTSGTKSVGEPACRDAQLILPAGRRGAFAGYRYPLGDITDGLLKQAGLPRPGSGASILVLGTGEFMYPPYTLALALENAGHNVHYQATTRSPILKGGAIGHIMEFEDNYGEGINNFLYNVQPGQYDKVLLCYETPALPFGHKLAEELGASPIFFTVPGA